LFAAKVVSVAVNIFMWGALARHMDKHVVILTLAAALLCVGLNCVLIPRFGILSAALVSCFAQLILLAGNVAFMVLSNRRLRPIA
jgi:O-antigen/teichoic acid export membrane protein